MKQTAVEYLVEQLLPKALSAEQYYHIEQAKAMEKAQITQSFVGGADFKEMAKNDNKRAIAYADRYYRNNYK